ncbi:MAG: hypothetical protein ACYDCK_05750 [Thermoplasmatota archaeon]
MALARAVQCSACGGAIPPRRWVCPSCHAVAARPVSVRKRVRPRPSVSRAFASLAVNFAVAPGAGTLLGGKRIGKAQLALFAVGLILYLMLEWRVGALLAVTGWLWSLASSVEIIDHASKAKAERREVQAPS